LGGREVRVFREQADDIGRMIGPVDACIAGVNSAMGASCNTDGLLVSAKLLNRIIIPGRCPHNVLADSAPYRDNREYFVTFVENHLQPPRIFSGSSRQGEGLFAGSYFPELPCPAGGFRDNLARYNDDIFISQAPDFVDGTADNDLGQIGALSDLGYGLQTQYFDLFHD